jgi:HSP20 family protein
LRSELDHLLDSFLGASGETENIVSAPLDVTEDKDRFVVKAELPGVVGKDVSVSVENGVLTIRGEKKQETEEKGKSFHRVERRYGSFQRALTLPGSADPNRTEAVYRDGVLTIRIAKREEVKPKVIEVKVQELKAASA